MQPWIPPAIFALVVWAVQRAVSKAALAHLATPQFYVVSALVSLPVYVPYVAAHPPAPSAFPAAFGVSCLQALTFWVTTEAVRRGPVGRVSPITGVGPALTALLAVVFLHELPSWIHVLGIVGATGAVALLGYRSSEAPGEHGWLPLATGSLVLQGVGAFLAKVAITAPGPSALLLTSASVQVVVGFALLRRAGLSLPRRGTPLLGWTILVLAAAAAATIGYLRALGDGPASVIVPLVATAPALGGLIGAVVLRERAGPVQYAGIALGVAGAALLSAPT